MKKETPLVSINQILKWDNNVYIKKKAYTVSFFL